MTLCSRIFLLFSHVFISQGQGTMKMCKICILHRSIRHIFISSHLHQWLITFLLLFLQMGQGWPPDPRGDRRQLRGGGGPLLLHRVCVLWGDQRPGEHQHQQKRGRVLWAPLFFPLFHSSTHSPDTVGLKTFFSAGPQSHICMCDVRQWPIVSVTQLKRVCMGVFPEPYGWGRYPVPIILFWFWFVMIKLYRYKGRYN